VGTLDEGTATELAEALRGSVTLRRIDLQPLIKRLAGRRLPAEKILSLVADWLGKSRSGELVAVEGSGAAGGRGTPPEAGDRTGAFEWWILANARIFPGLAEAAQKSARRSEDLEEELERRFPAGPLSEHLRRLESPDLLHYIRSEPLHTRAIEASWQILAERVLKGETAAFEQPLAEQPLHCRHADPQKAARIEERLRMAAEISEKLALPFPGRLSLRPALETFLTDPWTGVDLQDRAAEILRRTVSLGEEWLAGLRPVEAIDLKEKRLLLLVDGVPPDVWLECMDLIDAYPEGFSTDWARLEVEPQTLPATVRLLGVEDDPLEALEARGIPYLLLKPREEEDLENLLDSLPSDKAAVIRLGTLDRGAHQGAYKLADMAVRLRHLLETKLPALHRFCRQGERELILTTDHGLSLTAAALSHGQGGVYERAIFRARWSF
jgi:hypothetical protein